jgi:hypothetical protein
MASIEFHKGTFCSYMSAFCREGFRSGCDVCQKRTLYIRKPELYSKAGDERKTLENIAASLRS